MGEKILRIAASALLLIATSQSNLAAQEISYEDGEDHAIAAADVVSDFISVSNASRLTINGTISNDFDIILGQTEIRPAIDVTSGKIIVSSPTVGEPSITAGLPFSLSQAASMEAYSGKIVATGGIDIATVAVNVDKTSRLGLFGTSVSATAGADLAVAITSAGDTLMTDGLVTAEGGGGDAVAVRVSDGRFAILGGEILGRFQPGVSVDAGNLLMNGGTIANSSDGIPVPTPGVHVLGTAIFADGVAQGDGSTTSTAVVVEGQATFSGAAMSGLVSVVDNGKAYVSNIRSFGADELQTNLTDNAEMTLAATDLNYPTDQPVADLTGTVTGKWANGESFSLAFDRSANSVINFVEPVLGDFDGDRAVTASDIDIISASLHTGKNAVQFDVTSDGMVDQTDRQSLISDLAGYVVGDSNLDGSFNSSDLVRVFAANTYEDDAAMNSTWETGDWTGDLEFDTADLILAFQSGAYETDAPAARMVPEPTGCAALVLLSCYALRISRNRAAPRRNRV